MKGRGIILVIRRPTMLCAAFVCVLVVLSFYLGMETAVPVRGHVVRKVVCLDPGHGGDDPGAVGRSGVLEKDVNLAICKLLKGYLETAGAKVVLTRERDEDLSAGGIDDLDRRVAIAKESGAHVFLSIHCNGFPSPIWYGAQTFYRRDGHPRSKRLAEVIQEELVRITEYTEREALGGIEQYVLKKMNVPACLVEVGFLSNPDEERRLADPEYQAKVAWAIFVGVSRFFSEGRWTASAGHHRDIM